MLIYRIMISIEISYKILEHINIKQTQDYEKLLGKKIFDYFHKVELK